MLQIACIQYDIVWEDKLANFEKIEKFASDHKRPFDILVLPEMFNTGFSMNNSTLMETMDGSSIKFLQSLSAKTNALIITSLMISEDDHCFNRCVIIDGDSKIRYYDKRYLFSPSGEDKHYKKGQNRIVIEYKGWKICPLVCYDLRFPVWSMNTEEIDLYVYVANWPEPRIKHWERLITARAIENQAYVLGVNRVGVDGNKLNYVGASMLADFNGDQVVYIENKEALSSVKLNRDKLVEFREKHPFLNDLDDFSVKL